MNSLTGAAQAEWGEAVAFSQEDWPDRRCQTCGATWKDPHGGEVEKCDDCWRREHEAAEAERERFEAEADRRRSTREASAGQSAAESA